MSLRALHSAASGMNAQMTQLDNIANNMANAGTTGFKRTRTHFEDAFYQHYRLPGAEDPNSGPIPLGLSVGYGTRVSSTSHDLSPGSIIETKNPLDLAIDGIGFFQLQGPNGRLYSRAGNFFVNTNGQMVLGSAQRGSALDPPIQIPTDFTTISIAPDGTVNVTTQGNNQQQEIGQIQIARFANPHGLIHVGDNLFQATNGSGDAQLAAPQQQGLGGIRGSALEISNVEPVEELITLIKTQRNVELNSQIVQAADQLLQLVTNLRRF